MKFKWNDVSWSVMNSKQPQLGITQICSVVSFAFFFFTIHSSLFCGFLPYFLCHPGDTEVGFKPVKLVDGQTDIWFSMPSHTKLVREAAQRGSLSGKSDQRSLAGCRRKRQQYAVAKTGPSQGPHSAGHNTGSLVHASQTWTTRENTKQGDQLTKARKRTIYAPSKVFKLSRVIWGISRGHPNVNLHSLMQVIMTQSLKALG